MTAPHLPAGSAAADGYDALVTPERAGWTYSGLRVLTLAAGASHRLDTGPEELLVLPLSGSASVTCGDTTLTLAGRVDVFAGVTDFAYLPRESGVTIGSADGGVFALPSARCERSLPFRYGDAAGVSVEFRGAGASSRQVNNFCSPEAFETDKLCSVEVLTPGGNWSSYPPHKHDAVGPHEAVLEEIYYFLARTTPADGGPPDGGSADGGSAGTGSDAPLGYQQVYGSGPGKDIDVLAQVRSGDVVLVPHGYHGPSMAAPGYDLYYLNVLAGPAAERSMAFCDDPAHAWVRESWAGVPTDPRLPFGQEA